MIIFFSRLAALISIYQLPPVPCFFVEFAELKTVFCELW